MDEQAIAAIETRTYRFAIERLTDGGDCWQVMGDMTGSWDIAVLNEYLGDADQAGRYRVIRYAETYCELSEFNVEPLTTWKVDRVLLPTPEATA